MYRTFRWSDKKAEQNWKKHQVRFTEAATVLQDLLLVEGLDDSQSEERWVAIGQSSAGRVLLVVYREINEDTARIISAREATPFERKQYEEGI